MQILENIKIILILGGHIIATEIKPDTGIMTIHLHPTVAFEDDIAHEIIEIRLGIKYPNIELKLENINASNVFFMKYLRGKIFSGLIDFEVDRLVDKKGFDSKKSNERDKRGCLYQWSKNVPFDDTPFKDKCNKKIWDSIRKVEAGAILAHIWDLLIPEEKDKISKIVKEKMPDAHAIASWFYSHGTKGWKSTSEFAESLKDIIDKLHLAEFFVIKKRDIEDH